MARIYDHNWRRVRSEVLADRPVCEIRGPKCTGIATQVDHIVPVEAGGARLEPANLRPSCAKCNSARASREKARDGWRRSNTRIVLIMGPPGAGKSTLAQERAGPYDVVVDYDEISAAFGPTLGHGATQRHSVTMAARNAVLTQIRRGDVDAETVWIISTNPNARNMFPYHDVIVVDPGEDVVLRQAADAGRPAFFVQLIQDWYATTSAPSGAASREW